MFWVELTSDAFPEAVRRAEGVCLVPLGCVERHAHHLPLFTDMITAREVCRRASELEPVVIFPDIYFTQILEARHVPGTVAVSPDLMLRLLDEVCAEVARNGLHKVVLVNGHGGNNNLLHFFLQSRLARPYDYVAYLAEPKLLPEDEAVIAGQWESTVDGHAGEVETSIMAALRPDLVHWEALPEDGEGMPQGRLATLVEAGIRTPNGWYSDHPTHYRGDGRPGTAEKGERLLGAMARALARAVRLIKQDTETRRLLDSFDSAAAAPLAGPNPRRGVEGK
jgi:creatinine amidohydrolase